MSTYKRPWRYGTDLDLKLDSLADRMIGGWAEMHKDEFLARVRALADLTDLSMDDQLAAIVARAVEHVHG